jgi:large subunit ribosomal protein L9
MKVLFKKDVGGVGQRGTVKEVSDGYALNFLIPNGLAEQATDDTVAAYKKQVAEQQKGEQLREARMKEVAKKLDGATVEIKVNANDRGNLYKQLSAADIASAVQSHFKEVIASNAISLSAPIKHVGTYPITIQCGSQVATISLTVVA